MAWMAIVIFIPFFAPSLKVLAFGEAMCGIPWGVFQVLFKIQRVVVYTLTEDLAIRHSRQPTPARLYPQSSDPMSRHMCACVGVQVFFFPPVSSER
jgi:hypothetical protein